MYAPGLRAGIGCKVGIGGARVLCARFKNGDRILVDSTLSKLSNRTKRLGLRHYSQQCCTIRLTSSVDCGFKTTRDWPLYLPIQSLLNWSKSVLSAAFAPSVDMTDCGARKDRKCATSASVGVVSECKSRRGLVEGARRGRYTAQRVRRNI